MERPEFTSFQKKQYDVQSHHLDKSNKYTNLLSSKTSYPDVECASDIDPQIRVTDGTQELKADVGYHR